MNDDTWPFQANPHKLYPMHTQAQAMHSVRRAWRDYEIGRIDYDTLYAIRQRMAAAYPHSPTEPKIMTEFKIAYYAARQRYFGDDS